jgi:DNA-binding SARP family transcriptional activator
LFPGAAIDVDALHFEELARVAIGQCDPAAAQQALEWYSGELLPDDRYEDWAFDRRELLHLRRLDVLRVANEWRELAEVEPADEEAYVHLMRRHIDAGDRTAALRQCRHYERVLQRDLGVEPGAAARQVCLEASLLGRSPAPPVASRVEALLAEMAQLVSRQTAVLAELAESGTAPPSLVV